MAAVWLWSPDCGRPAGPRLESSSLRSLVARTQQLCVWSRERWRPHQPGPPSGPDLLALKDTALPKVPSPCHVADRGLRAARTVWDDTPGRGRGQDCSRPRRASWKRRQPKDAEMGGLGLTKESHGVRREKLASSKPKLQGCLADLGLHSAPLPEALRRGLPSWPEPAPESPGTEPTAQRAGSGRRKVLGSLVHTVWGFQKSHWRVSPNNRASLSPCVLGQPAASLDQAMATRGSRHLLLNARMTQHMKLFFSCLSSVLGEAQIK